jgi:GNAT superfamily N-acetyltransferase
MLTIRDAAPGDAPLILAFIRELAEYEKLAHEVVATEEGLARELFGDAPVAHALIASWGGEPAGFALYFYNFSTFLGRTGLYLEDLFVRPAHRRHGIGRRLLVELARRAEARGCGRMEWAALDWNEPALRFYRELGARTLDEWVTHRLGSRQIAALAAEGEGAGNDTPRD